VQHPTSQKLEMNPGAPKGVVSSCTTSGSRRVTVKRHEHHKICKTTVAIPMKVFSVC